MNHPSTTVVRRAARALALVPAILVTSATGSAFAEAPEQWQDNGSVSPLHVLMVLVVIPVALFALICLLVYLPSMKKGQLYQPGLAWRNEPEWFGGPRGGAESADVSQPGFVGAGSATDTDPDRGGASGRW
ncbi:aa3-type cytochrome oxidase subunit CtaJ [Nocardioides panacis]